MGHLYHTLPKAKEPSWKRRWIGYESQKSGRTRTNQYILDMSEPLLVRSQQLLLPAQDLNKIKPDNTQA